MREQQLEISEKDVIRCASVFRSLKKVKLKVLLYLYFTPNRTHKQIAERLMYHGAAIRDVLNAASKQGLVERREGKYRLTKPGKRLVEGMVELIAAMKEEG